MQNDFYSDTQTMKGIKKSFLFFLILNLSFFLTAQSENTYEKILPRGYHKIELGMSLEDTKTALLKDSTFGYHGDRDVSLIPGTNRILIETDSEYGHGSDFLSRCWFQFTQDQLYTITININQNKMDYYSMFTTLTKKYGEPDSLNPQKAVWKNEQTTLSLEKPLTIKYIDNELFDSTQNYSNLPKTGTEITRKMFLDEF